MKPRLKLSLAGKLTLIAEGESGLSEEEVRESIYQRFETLTAFAKHFDRPYESVCAASSHPSAANRGGKTAEVRRILGLPVRTKRIALAQMAASARRKAHAIATFPPSTELY